jgi:hypothetical protein
VLCPLTLPQVSRDVQVDPTALPTPDPTVDPSLWKLPDNVRSKDDIVKAVKDSNLEHLVEDTPNVAAQDRGYMTAFINWKAAFQKTYATRTDVSP